MHKVLMPQFAKSCPWFLSIDTQYLEMTEKYKTERLLGRRTEVSRGADVLVALVTVNLS